MTTLHILKSNPEDATESLINILSNGKDATRFPLYEGKPDYGKLIDLIFEHDHNKVFSWW